MKKLFKVLLVAVMAITMMSCQKEVITPNTQEFASVEKEGKSQYIPFSQVTPNNAEAFIDQQGCEDMPDINDDWSWISVQHTGGIATNLTNIGVFQVVTLSDTQKGYASFPHMDIVWKNLKCSIMIDDVTGKRTYIKIVGDIMLQIDMDTFDVWYLERV